MSAKTLAETLNQHRYVARTQADASGCRGCRWTFKWANTETARTAHAAHLADVVTAHLAARLEGCREEVGEAIYQGVVIDEAECEGDVAAGALDVVRSALGLEPPSDALRGASDGRTGRDGTSMQGERAGDGL